MGSSLIIGDGILPLKRRTTLSLLRCCSRDSNAEDNAIENIVGYDGARLIRTKIINLGVSRFVVHAIHSDVSRQIVQGHSEMGSRDKRRRVGWMLHLLPFVIDAHVESATRILCEFNIVDIISKIADHFFWGWTATWPHPSMDLYIRLSSAAARRLVDNPSKLV